MFATFATLSVFCGLCGAACFLGGMPLAGLGALSASAFFMTQAKADDDEE